MGILNRTSPGGVVWPAIDQSVRFNSADGDILSFTPTVDGDLRKGTFSFWLKRVTLGTLQEIYTAYVSAGSRWGVQFTTGDKLEFTFNTSSNVASTDAVYRDTTNWYHFCISYDTDQAASADRVTIEVNGVEQSYTWNTPVTQNSDTEIGANGTLQCVSGETPSNYHLDALLADFHYLNGQVLAASNFGQYDPSTPTFWRHKPFTGV